MNTTNLKQINKTLEKILESMATKDDTKYLESKMDELRKDLKRDIEDSAAYIIASVDKSKEDKKDLDNLENRVSVIEEELSVTTRTSI